MTINTPCTPEQVILDGFARWLIENPEPSLAELVRQHGNYSAIPAEAWADFDRKMTDWQRRRCDRFNGPFVRALIELRHDVARRAARIRRQSR